MAWITCATCGVKRGGVDHVFYHRASDEVAVYDQPACWNCDAPGWQMPADQDPQEMQPLGRIEEAGANPYREEGEK